MKKKIGWLLLLALLLLFPASVRAQEGGTPVLTLSLSRDWGYGGLDGRIEGRFTLKVKDGAAFERVIFYLDETEMAVLDEPPFSFQFHTGDYPPGPHRLRAVGFTADGRRVESNLIEATFISAEESRSLTLRIVGIVTGLSLLATVLAGGAALALGRQRKGKEGYGLLGGTICPHCGRPYAMHFYALNLVTHRYDRCPHCGRWALVQRQPLSALEAAERQAAAAASSPAESELDEAERLRRLLDESRYE